MDRECRQFLDLSFWYLNNALWTVSNVAQWNNSFRNHNPIILVYNDYKGIWSGLKYQCLKRCMNFEKTHFFSVRLPKRLEDNSAHFLPWIWTFLHTTNSVQPKLRFGKIQKYRTESFCHFWPYFRLFHLQLTISFKKFFCLTRKINATKLSHKNKTKRGIIEHMRFGLVLPIWFG